MHWPVAILVCLAIGWHLGGWHIKHTPTPDELFGCTWANTTPSGECR